MNRPQGGPDEAGSRTQKRERQAGQEFRRGDLGPVPGTPEKLPSGGGG